MHCVELCIRVQLNPKMREPPPLKGDKGAPPKCQAGQRRRHRPPFRLANPPARNLNAPAGLPRSFKRLSRNGYARNGGEKAHNAHKVVPDGRLQAMVADAPTVRLP
jgi:hypothetical protein